jgi:hypothetical protein
VKGNPVIQQVGKGVKAEVVQRIDVRINDRMFNHKRYVVSWLVFSSLTPELDAVENLRPVVQRALASRHSLLLGMQG